MPTNLEPQNVNVTAPQPDPVPLSVSASQPAGLTPPGPAPLAPLPIPRAPATTSPPSGFGDPQAESTERHASLGMGVKRLLGSLYGGHYEHAVNPQTGKMDSTWVKDKGSDLFRHLIVGAILGSAAASEAHAKNSEMGFAGGLATGGAEGVAEGQREDAMRRQAAQADFERGQTVKRATREEQESTARIDMLKATSMEANARTLQLNAMTQGQLFDQHQKLVDAEKPMADAYQAAGAHPVYDGILESQHGAILQRNPEAASLRWFPVGTRVTGVNAKGMPTYELVYRAYNPDEKLAVTQGMLDKWKEVGMDKYYPEDFSKVLKVGKALTPEQAITLHREYDGLLVDKIKRDTAFGTEEERQAKIRRDNAESVRLAAETTKVRVETTQAGEEKKKEQLFAKALGNWNKVASDPANAELNPEDRWKKLSPGDQVVIAESLAPTIRSMTDALKAMPKNEMTGEFEDPATAGRLVRGIESLSSLGRLAVLGEDPISRATQVFQSFPPDRRAAALGQAVAMKVLTQSEARQIAEGLGIKDEMSSAAAKPGAATLSRVDRGILSIAKLPSQQQQAHVDDAVAKGAMTEREAQEMRQRLGLGATAGGSEMVAVQLPDGRAGQIPRTNLEKFLKENPGAKQLR